MNDEKLKQLSDEATSIAKEMATALKQFNKETAMMLYAKQWSNKEINIVFPDGTEHKKIDNKEATRKLDKMMKEARLKWDYASEKDKKRVAEMEKIVTEGQERIKALYKTD